MWRGSVTHVPSGEKRYFEYPPMNSSQETSHAFIVRFWLEPQEIQGAKSEWQGVVEHVPSGRRVFVKSACEAIAFVQEFLAELVRFQ